MAAQRHTALAHNECLKARHLLVDLGPAMNAHSQGRRLRHFQHSLAHNVLFRYSYGLRDWPPRLSKEACPPAKARSRLRGWSRDEAQWETPGPWMAIIPQSNQATYRGAADNVPNDDVLR